MNDLRQAMIDLLSTDKARQNRAVEALTPFVRSRANVKRFSRLDPDDALQIAMQRVWQAAPNYDASLPPEPFIASVVIRALITECKSRVSDKHKAIDLATPIVWDDEDGLTEKVIEGRNQNVKPPIEVRELRSLIFGQITNHLSALENVALRGYVNKTSYVETAERYAVSEKAVDNARQRAFAKLRHLSAAIDPDQPMNDQIDDLLTTLKTHEILDACREREQQSKPKRKPRPRKKTTNKGNAMSKVIDIKVKLYDTIEQQAVLQAEFNRLETLKGELAKELGEARKAEEAKPKAKSIRAEVGDDLD